MKLTKANQACLVVVAIFTTIIAILLLMIDFRSDVPLADSSCINQCKASGMEGHMIYKYSETMTAGMRDRGPLECKCFQHGTNNPQQP